MDYQIFATDLLKGKELKTLEHILLDLELALVTVQDVIDRNADGASFEDSYIGVNLALYVRHTEATLMKFRQLLDHEKRNHRRVGLLAKPSESADDMKANRKECV